MKNFFALTALIFFSVQGYSHECQGPIFEPGLESSPLQVGFKFLMGTKEKKELQIPVGKSSITFNYRTDNNTTEQGQLDEYEDLRRVKTQFCTLFLKERREETRLKLKAGKELFTSKVRKSAGSPLFELNVKPFEFILCAGVKTYEDLQKVLSPVIKITCYTPEEVETRVNNSTRGRKKSQVAPASSSSGTSGATN